MTKDPALQKLKKFVKSWGGDWKAAKKAAKRIKQEQRKNG
jgi:hypothetical protein